MTWTFIDTIPGIPVPGGDTPPGAAVMTDVMSSKLIGYISESNSTPTDTGTFGGIGAFINESNVTPSDVGSSGAVTAGITETNLTPDDTSHKIGFTYTDTNAGLNDTVLRAGVTYAETNAIPDDTVQRAGMIYTDLNAELDDTVRRVGFSGIALTESNLVPTDSLTADMELFISETSAGQDDSVIKTGFSGPAVSESNLVQGETASGSVRYFANASLVVPAGVTSMIMETWGSGAGGGKGSATNGGIGAPGGDYTRSVIAVTPSETLTIVVGAQRAGSTTTAIGIGNDSRVDRGGTPLIRAKGGGSASSNLGDVIFTGGVQTAGGVTQIGAGGGGGGGGAGNGTAGLVAGTAGVGGVSQAGGLNPGGNGGAGAAAPAVGGAGVVPGGGGAGGSYSVTAPPNGGIGAAGMVRMTW